MKYNKNRQIIEIETEKDIHYFFKAFKCAVTDYDDSISLYSGTYDKNTCFDTLRGDCASLIYTSPNGFVFYGEVFCNDDKIYATARKYYYDTDNFTRDEIAEITEHIYTYWGIPKDEKDKLVLDLAMKRKPSDDSIRMLVGSIFENSLEVDYSGYEPSNFLPKVVEEIVDLGDIDEWDMTFTIEFGKD